VWEGCAALLRGGAADDRLRLCYRISTSHAHVKLYNTVQLVCPDGCPQNVFYIFPDGGQKCFFIPDGRAKILFNQSMVCT
jgi:hypothetical protein